MKRITLQVGTVAVLAVSLGFGAPAGDVRADEPTEAQDGDAQAGESKDWADHMGDIPFVVGRAAGEAEADFTGKPPMYFFTTTW